MLSLIGPETCEARNAREARAGKFTPLDNFKLHVLNWVYNSYFQSNTQLCGELHYSENIHFSIFFNLQGPI